MFGVPLWAIIAAIALLALALLVFAACVLAGQKPHPRPPAHQRPRDNHPRPTREDWLNATTGSFSLDDERALRGRADMPRRDLRPFPGDEGATVIEGPWSEPEPEAQPCCGQALAYCYCADRAAPWPVPVEDLPAPELLDDLPPDQDAFGLCGCMCLCWDGADGPDNLCARCRAGNHAPRRAADDDDPGWVTRLAAELDEDQGYRCPDCGREECDGRDCYWPDQAGIPRPELDENQAVLAGTLDELYEEQGGEFVEPELVLAEEAHAAQLRAQDADARAFMEGKAAELAEFRRSLGPAR